MRVIDMLSKFFLIAGSQSTKTAILRQIIVLFRGLTDILNMPTAQIVFIEIGTIDDFRYLDFEIANLTFYCSQIA